MRNGSLRVFASAAIACLAYVLTTDFASAAEQKSEALLIAQASGLKKLRDVNEKDLERALRSSGGVPTATLATHSLGTATGAFPAPRGISSGAAAGISGALAFLGTLPVDRPERQARFLIWLPESEATDLNDARRRVTEVIRGAISKAHPEAPVELGKREQHPRTVIQIPGRGALSSWVFDNAPRVIDAPPGLGGQRAYVWGGFNNEGVGTLDGYPLTDPLLTPQQRIEFFTSVSANLPSWICIYLPPDDRIAPYPQILRNGETLLFVEPGLLAQVSTDVPEVPRDVETQ